MSLGCLGDFWEGKEGEGERWVCERDREEKKRKGFFFYMFLGGGLGLLLGLWPILKRVQLFETLVRTVILCYDLYGM